jgi:hypothetical protein
MTPTASVIYVDKAHTADYATQAGTAQSAGEAGSFSISGSATLSGLNLVGGGTTGSINVNQALYVSASYAVDTIPLNKGNAVKWFVFLGDGPNSRANKVVASWNNTSSSFYCTEIESIGTVPVNLDVKLFPSGVSLIVNPDSGSWAVKFIRILI